MSRYFNYLENENEFYYAYLTSKKILNDILNFNLGVSNAKEKTNILKLQKRAMTLKKELEKLTSKASSVIFLDLLENDEKYSKTGEKANKLFKQIFDLENEIHKIVSNEWSRIVTPFNKIENGKDFILFGYSCNQDLKYVPYDYKYDEYNKVEAYFCSIFTNNSMNLANSKIVVLFDVNESNFLTTSYQNSEYKKLDSKLGVTTLKITSNGKNINSGRYFPLNSDAIPTKSEDPITTLNKICKFQFMQNEALLDKENSTPVGLVLFSNGDDFLFREYLTIKSIKNNYNLDFKVINKTLYFDRNVNIKSLTQSLEKSKATILSLDIEYDELCELLDSYISEVIIPLKLSPEVEKIQIEFINGLKEKNKVLKY